MDYIIIAVVIVIIGLAVGYIVKAKKNGVKCIGCSACNNRSDNNLSSCCCCNRSEQSNK